LDSDLINGIKTSQKQKKNLVYPKNFFSSSDNDRKKKIRKKISDGDSIFDKYNSEYFVNLFEISENSENYTNFVLILYLSVEKDSNSKDRSDKIL